MAQLPPGVDPSKVPLLPPPQGQTSNVVNPPTLAHVAEGMGGVLIAIETILLVLRTCSNYKTFGRLRFEDYWIFWAALLTYGYFSLIMLFRPIFRHEWDIPLTASTESLVFQADVYYAWIDPACLFQRAFAQEMMLGSTLFFAKTSLLLLFYRVFSPDKLFRYKLYGAFIFIALTTLRSIPVYLAMCTPSRRGFWLEAESKCSRTSVYSYVQGPAAIVFDLFLIYLPASVIVHLQMPLRRKIGILAIFATGMFAVLASVVGLVYRIKLVHNADSTWASAIVELCLLVESCVSIICSCMPAIPAISNQIVANSYLIHLRSRLHSRYASSDKLKSPHPSSRRETFPGQKTSDEYEPYIKLIDRGTAHLGTPSTTKTQIHHVPSADLQHTSGINMSVELEVSSTENRHFDSHNVVT